MFIKIYHQIAQTFKKLPGHEFKPEEDDGTLKDGGEHAE